MYTWLGLVYIYSHIHILYMFIRLFDFTLEHRPVDDRIVGTGQAAPMCTYIAQFTALVWVQYAYLYSNVKTGKMSIAVVVVGRLSLDNQPIVATSNTGLDILPTCTYAKKCTYNTYNTCITILIYSSPSHLPSNPLLFLLYYYHCLGHCCC